MQVRRLKEFGVTKGELTRYMDALLKDSEHLAAMIDNVSSVDNLDFIMESDALGHTVMDQRQGHESLVAVAGTVALEEVTYVPKNSLSQLSCFLNQCYVALFFSGHLFTLTSVFMNFHKNMCVHNLVYLHQKLIIRNIWNFFLFLIMQSICYNWLKVA